MISILIAVEGERAKTVDIDRVVEYFGKVLMFNADNN